MNSNIFESDLLNFFSEVIYVNSNPYNLKVEKKFKENGKLKTIKENFKIDLKSIYISEKSKNLMMPECSCYGISDDIKVHCESLKFKLSLNIFESIYTKKSSKLSKFLNSYLDKEDYIITGDRIIKNIKGIENKIFSNDMMNEFFQEKMRDTIIVGKKSPIYLLKTYDKLKGFDCLEVYFQYDKSKFKVIKLV